MSERFYLPELAADSEVEMDGSEAHHMLRVMRVTPGATVRLFDGRGQEARGVVAGTTRKSVVIRVGTVSRIDRELAVNLVMGVCLPKADRARFLVEKLTELGVTRLVPLLTGRSTVKPRTTSTGKLARYVIEASKQCGRNQLMQIQAPTRIEDFAVQRSLFESGIVLQPDCDCPLTVHDVRDVASLAVCVGPEGGWSSGELDLLVGGGWHPRQLGARILRTETAAMALAAVFSSLLQPDNGQPAC